MSTVIDRKDVLFQSIEENKELYIQTSQDIHANPEIGNQEFYASKRHVENLRNAGFAVTTAVAGHESLLC